MVSFELYPWHSNKITSSMQPDPGIVRDWVWEPIADLGQSVVFAFGSEWFRLLPTLGLEVIGVFGEGGRTYGSGVRTRSILVGRTEQGSLVVAEKHRGSAAPPSAAETTLMRAAVDAS
jgi:hypothetical protein